MFGFSDVDRDIFLLSNHILLLFKRFIYISRDSNILLISRFFRNLQKAYTIEQKISQESERKKELFYKKLQKIQNKLWPFKNVCYIKVGWGLGSTMCETTVVCFVFIFILY